MDLLIVQTVHTLGQSLLRGIYDVSLVCTQKRNVIELKRDVKYLHTLPAHTWPTVEEEGMLVDNLKSTSTYF